jgi:WD40 repeat protein
LISVSYYNSIYIWETKNNNYTKIKEIKDLPIYWNSLNHIPSSDFLISQNKNNNKLILWRISTQEIVWKSDPLEYESTCIKVIPEQRKILVGCYNLFIFNAKCIVIKF